MLLQYEKRVGDLYMTQMESFSFLPHVHHCMELLLCTDGELDVSCNHQRKSLKPGDMMIAFSHDIHAYFQTSSGRGIMIIVNPQLFPMVQHRLQNKRYGNFLTDESGQCMAVAQAALAEYQGDCAQEILVGYLYVILGTALKKLPAADQQDCIRPDTFSQVLEYLSVHYTEPISLKGLARVVGMDPHYLSRMFRQRLSCGFLEYLHFLRVEHAKELLINTDSLISQIAMESGFSDQKTFNRVFKQIEHTTPRDYRRNT